MNSTVELLKAAITKKDEAEIISLTSKLGERLKFLQTQTTYQADDERIEIEDFFMNSVVLEIPTEDSTPPKIELILGSPLKPLEEPEPQITTKPPEEVPEPLKTEPVVEEHFEVHPSKWREKPFPFRYVKWFTPPAERLDMNKPYSIGISGGVETGKTSLIEAILIMAIQANQTALIVGGAEDDEIVTAFRAPFRDNVIAITGEEIKTFTGAPHMTYKEFNTDYPKRAHYYVMSKSFFAKEEIYSMALLDILERFRGRKKWKSKYTGGYPHIIWCAVPESADVIAAKLITGQTQDEKEAIRYFDSLSRKLRHTGVGIIFDFQRETSVSAEVRTLTQIRFWTNQAFMKVDPKLWRWMFRYLRLDFFRRIKPGEAVMVNRGGGGCLVKWPLPKFHIDRGEDVLADVGITLSFDDDKVKEIMASLKKDSRTSKLTEEDDKEIYDRIEAGESAREVALDMRLNHGTVNDHYKVYKRDHPKK